MWKIKILSIIFLFGVSCMQDGRGLYAEDVNTITLQLQAKSQSDNNGLIVDANIFRGVQSGTGASIYGNRDWTRLSAGRFVLYKTNIGVPVSQNNSVIVASIHNLPPLSSNHTIYSGQTSTFYFVEIKDELFNYVDDNFSWIIIK